MEKWSNELVKETFKIKVVPNAVKSEEDLIALLEKVCHSETRH